MQWMWSPPLTWSNLLQALAKKALTITSTLEAEESALEVRAVSEICCELTECVVCRVTLAASCLAEKLAQSLKLCTLP